MMSPFTRNELLDAARDGDTLGRWRRGWEGVRGTRGQWNFLRAMYAAVTPRIIAGEWRYADLIEWRMTPIELDLWVSIRYYGLPFWPQYPVGRFFVDFADPAMRIALECDGARYHDARRDAQRDAELHAIGWRVFRFPGWRCYKGADDPQSADAMLLEALRPFYPKLRGLSERGDEEAAS